MRNRWRLPILMYHHVCPDLDRYTNTPPDLFALQLETVARRRAFWTLADAHRAWLAGEPPDGRAVVTFDDGYADVVEWALPTLERLQVRATFFVLPAFVGQENRWNSKSGYRARHASWSHLERLRDAGHEIGSHSLTHRALDELDAAEVERELLESQQMLRERLDVPARSFAYPYGRVGPWMGAASRHYDVAVSTTKSDDGDWAKARFGLRRVFVPQAAREHEILSLLDEEGEP